MFHENELQKRNLLRFHGNEDKLFYNERVNRQTLSKKNNTGHKLAYLIIVHEDFENVILLIKSLVDPYVTILIHVDSENPSLKTNLLNFLQEQFVKKVPNYIPERIQVMKKSFKGNFL